MEKGIKGLFWGKKKNVEIQAWFFFTIHIFGRCFEDPVRRQ